jgi:hypothetical protein
LPYVDTGGGVLPTLAYCIAYSVPAAPIPGAPECGRNNYDIQLFACNDLDPLNFVGRISFTETCRLQEVDPLRFCPVNYVCYVVGFNGGLGRPTEPVYVEWHWILEYNYPVITSRPTLYNGKFVYVATVDWLVNQYNSTGYPIILLNQTNHTVKI